MRYLTLKLSVVLWLFLTAIAAAQPSSERLLPVVGKIIADGRAIELSWFEADPPRVGSVTVMRRLHGQTGGASWRPLATGLGPVMRYRDETIKPGVAYEYRVQRTARDIVDLGYWMGGVGLAAEVLRGAAYVIVDDTIAGPLAPRLTRFEQDLVADGWRVQQHRVPRGNDNSPAQNLRQALALKTWLYQHYVTDPFGHHMIILVGHVPIVRSGAANPDGHAVVPHPADVFYADMDGRWTMTRNGEVLNNQIPGDFIEAQVGRIDFSNHGFGDRDVEIGLLRAYFDKNHHWRMGYLGDLRAGYVGSLEHLTVEHFGLRNILGSDAVVAGGHHVAGEEKPWLWGVDFGDFNGYHYAEKYRNKAVFAINFGSGKQMIGKPYNAMSALLAQPWYPVAVGWGARPAWWLHHMALGGSIGEVHLRTVNNGQATKPYRETMDYFPTGNYLWRNPVWVNLLGDPSLRGFPLAPARRLQARADQDVVELSWQASPDPDVLGYRLFRAAPGSDVFTALTGPNELMTGLAFTDTNPVADARYMVRAYGLKTVHAGSFYLYAPGVFSDAVTAGLPFVPLATRSGQPVALPEAFNRVVEGQIHAIIAPPAVGQLDRTELGWQYTPPVSYTGEVTIRFSRSGTSVRETGVLTIRVRE